MKLNKVPFYFWSTLFYKTKKLHNRIKQYNIDHEKNPYIYKLHPVNLKTTSRDSLILPFCVGYDFLVSNGRIFSHVYVSENIIGYKFGEFCPTRRRYYYRLKKKKKKNR